MDAAKHILLVDGDLSRAAAFRKAFEDAGVHNRLKVFPDTDALQSFLTQQGAAQLGRISAGLVLLDLDQGVEKAGAFLKWLRTESNYPYLLSVGLSELPVGAFVQQLFDVGLNAYFHNGLRISGTVEMINDLEFLEDILLNRRENPEQRAV